jgi:hypothetical protein
VVIVRHEVAERSQALGDDVEHRPVGHKRDVLYQARDCRSRAAARWLRSPVSHRR